MISIAAQIGGPKDGNIGDLTVDLVQLFEKYCSKSYCPAIDEFAPVLRINGSLVDFGPDR